MADLQRQLLDAKRMTYAAKLAQARLVVEEKDAELSSAESVLRKYEELVSIAKEREENAQPLVQSGALSRVDYLQIKQDLVSNTNELAAQVKTVQKLKSAVREARQRVSEVEHEKKSTVLSDMNSLSGDIAGLKGMVAKSKQLNDLQSLRAPVDGFVQSVAVSTVGGVVSPAESLVTIVPKGTPLVVEASLSNEDIGFVKVGQRADIKIDSFPFQKYGSIGGTLVWVSPDAEDTSSAASTSGNTAGRTAQPNQSYDRTQKLTYKVHIQPDSQSIQADGKLVELSPGMTLQVDVKTNQRRVIEFFLSPVIKYLDEGMKVR